MLLQNTVRIGGGGVGGNRKIDDGSATGAVVVDQRLCLPPEDGELTADVLGAVVGAGGAIATGVGGDALQDDPGRALQHDNGADVDEGLKRDCLLQVAGQAVENQPIFVGECGSG